MILRKPYGFLIKHFRLIHLILTGIYIYLLMKVNSMLKYYNGFIEGTESKLNAINYVTNYYIFALVGAAIICLTIYALMRYKKKPKLFYLILIAFYIVVAIVINISYQGLTNIYMATVSAKDLRLYRDLLKIIRILQYGPIFMTLVRGLGFDIKKFNFKEDIAELDLDITDDEEIELTLGGSEGFQRKIRRQIREYIYYYKENKMFINIILIIIAVLFLSTHTINVQIINKEFKEGEPLSTDKFSFTVLESYLTNNSYDNSNITDSDSTFLIAKISINSLVGQTELNPTNMTLKIQNKEYTVNNRYSDYFKDIGTGYNGQTINRGSTYLFIYIIPSKDVNKKMQINYSNSKKINIKPINIDIISNKISAKIGENVDLSKTILDSGYFMINKYDLKKQFDYNYEYEAYGKKYTSKIKIVSQEKTILYLDISYKSNTGISYSDFITNYGKIKYKINGEEYTSQAPINKSPDSANNILYLEVDKQIENATNIWLEFNIRNAKIIYTLK